MKLISALVLALLVSHSAFGQKEVQPEHIAKNDSESRIFRELLRARSNPSPTLSAMQMNRMARALIDYGSGKDRSEAASRNSDRFLGYVAATLNQFRVGDQQNGPLERGHDWEWADECARRFDLVVIAMAAADAIVRAPGDALDHSHATALYGTGTGCLNLLALDSSENGRK